MHSDFFSFGFDPGRLLLWIVLLPLFGSIINGLAGKFASRKMVSAVAVGSVALAFGLAIACFVKLTMLRHAAGEEGEHARILYTAYEWFSVSVGNVNVPIFVRFVMDPLSGVMALVITGIGLLIHIYATSYMSEEPAYYRFFCYLNLFMASMLILVLSSNMALMFVGWEGVGLCSYLLIGFWWENPTYAAAGKKAFVVNRIGDFGVLIGMFLLVYATQSFEFDAIRHGAANLSGATELAIGGMAQADHHSINVSMATVACLFLFLGCAGKSAQIPLYVWLPDAMAGPTPVSALIHAATMVTAGVYLIVRLSPVFVMSPVAMSVIAIIGASTALLAATIALVQNQMKKILAYSTVSQLGFMFAAVGVGAFSGGFFHVFTHAFFKACLFLGAGSVMHAVHAHGDADIRELGGMKKFMPRTRMTFLISCLAIAGFPLTSGFFSKDDILLGAAFVGTGAWADYPSWVGWLVLVMLVIAATMTAFYMFRLYFLTFEGDFRGAHGEQHAAAPPAPSHPGVEGAAETHALEASADAHAVAHDAHGHDAHDDHAHGHDAHGHGGLPHESNGAITWPLMILAFGALAVGFLGLPHWAHLPNIWEHWLEPVSARLPGVETEASAGLGGTMMLIGTLAGLTGIAIAYRWYMMQAGETPAALAARFPRLQAFLMDKWRVDELYARIIIKPAEWLSNFSSEFDKVAVDGGLTKLPAFAAQAGSWAFTRLQNGLVYSYGAVMVAGIVAITFWYLIPHPNLQSAVQGADVKYVAATGYGYEYRWDVDLEPGFETNWDTNTHEMTASFERAARNRGAAVMNGRPGSPPPVIQLRHGELYAFNPRDFATTEWMKPNTDGTPPAMTWQDGKLLIRVNDAEVRQDGLPTTTPTISLAPGESVTIGGRLIRAAGVMRGTVEVRNVFGYVSRESVEVTIENAMPQAAPRGAEAHADLRGGL